MVMPFEVFLFSLDVGQAYDIVLLFQASYYTYAKGICLYNVTDSSKVDVRIATFMSPPNLYV